MKKLKTLLSNLAHPTGIIGLAAAIAIPFFIYLAPNIGAKGVIRTLDLRLPLPLFLAQTAAGIVLFVLLFKDFRLYIKERLPAKPFLVAISVFAVIATAFAGTQIEARHRVQSDESVFMSIAQNMYSNQTTGTCDEGEFQDGKLDCYKNSDSFKTKGLSFLYLLGMPFLGTDLHWIFTVQLISIFFAALLLFFAIRAWTEDDLLALLSSVILFSQPTVLFQFRSMSVEPLYILLSALALWTLKWAFDRNTVRHWILCALVLAFFAETRQETVFCFLAFLVVAIPKLLDKKDGKAPAFFFTLSLFSVPVLLTISYFQGYGFQGGEFSAHGHFLENLKSNWDVMTRPLDDDGLLSNPFLASFNYLFLAGLVILIVLAAHELLSKKFGTYSKILGFLILYHIQTYAILENVSGDFTIEINQRYALVMMPTMAFLAAFAIEQMFYLLLFLFGASKQKTNQKANFLIGIVFCIVFLSTTLNLKPSFNENIMYKRNHLTTEEVEIWKWIQSQPQKPRLFIYGRPWHFIAYGESAIHYNSARNIGQDSLAKLIDKYRGEVYYIRGLDCWDSKTYHAKAVEHRIPTTCDVFEREAKLEDVYQVLITNNYWVRIAKLKSSRGYDPQNLLAFGFWQGDPETRTLIMNYAAKFGTGDPWKIRFELNGDSVETVPYRAGDYSDTLSGPRLEPGYNRIEAIISDSTSGEEIARISNYRFFRFDGALQMSLMDPVRTSQGWGEFQKNKSIDGHSFTLHSTHYEDGFGTHAPSSTEFDLHGGFSRLKALIGLDEESLCSDGISYKIIGDGEILLDRPALKPDEVDTIDIAINGIHALEFRTDTLESQSCDHVDIVHPALFPSKESLEENNAAIRYRSALQ